MLFQLSLAFCKRLLSSAGHVYLWHRILKTLKRWDRWINGPTSVLVGKSLVATFLVGSAGQNRLRKLLDY